MRGFAVFAALAALVWLLAFHVGPAKWVDGATWFAFTRLDDTVYEPLVSVVARLGNAEVFALWALLVTGLALRTHGVRVAAVVVGILAVANAVTQLLKEALAELRVHEFVHPGDVYAASWPSGHATGGMSLALCLIVAAPPPWRRRAAALGATFAVAEAFAVTASGWHYPSDALGGFAVAGAVAWLALPLLRGVRSPAPQLDLPRPPVWLSVLIGAVLAGALAVVLKGSVDEGVDVALAFLLTAAAIVALALAMTSRLQSELCERPGSHSGSSPPLAARERMKKRSESRLR